MSELPPGVELVEIDDKEYDWTPCPKCGLARWWYTAATKRRPEVRMCFQCNPPPGVAFRLLELMHQSQGAPKR